MAYATASDIESMFKNISFGASSTITSTEISSFIDESDAIIDAHVSNRYVTPVTGTVALNLLRRISKMLTAHQVKLVLESKNISPELNQDVTGTSLEAVALKLLDKIANGKMVLTDATLVSSDGAVSSYNVDNEIEYTFKVDTDQW